MPQAVDLKKVQEAEAKLLFVEIYHTIGAQLAQSKFLRDVEIVTVFVSLIGHQEIDDLKAAIDKLINLLARAGLEVHVETKRKAA